MKLLKDTKLIIQKYIDHLINEDELNKLIYVKLKMVKPTWCNKTMLN
jgi:hypothetical protein